MRRVIAPIRARSPGFSLLELTVTISVVAILTGLAAPAVSGMWLDAQRVTAVNSFIHSVFLARSTATQRGHEVSICRSTDGQTCSNGLADWQVGWIVFVNNDRDQPPVRDGNEASARRIRRQGRRHHHVESSQLFVQAAPERRGQWHGGVLRPARLRRTPAQSSSIMPAGRALRPETVTDGLYAARRDSHHAAVWEDTSRPYAAPAARADSTLWRFWPRYW